MLFRSGTTGPFHATNASNPSTSRSWTDNGDFIVQGDPLNPLANGELGPSSNRNFGKTIVTTTLDPAIARGFGKRPYNWDLSAGVQHELRPQVSVSTMLFYRWFGNFGLGSSNVTENRAYTPADFTSYCITVPLDSRLPGGGGNTLCGLFDLDPAKAPVGQIDNVLTRARDEYKHWTGVDLTVNARLPRGLLLQGGLSTGKTTLDKCASWKDPRITTPVSADTTLSGYAMGQPASQVGDRKSVV